jgi:hypothetical protein
LKRFRAIGEKLSPLFLKRIMATDQKSAAAMEHVIPIICIASDLVNNNFYIVFKTFIHNGSFKIGHLVGLGSKVHGSRFRVNRFANFPDVTDFTGYELYLSSLSFLSRGTLRRTVFKVKDASRVIPENL